MKKYCLKLAITIILIFYFLYSSNVGNIFNTIISISFLTLCNACLLTIFAFFFYSFKWKLLLPQYNYLNLFQLNIIASYYSTLLPGQLAGEGVKAYLLGKEQTNKDKIITSILIDKITGVIGLLFLSILGLLFTKQNLPNNVTYSIILIISIGFFSLIFLRFQLFFKTLLTIMNFFKKHIKGALNIIIFSERILKSCHEYSKKTLTLAINIILGAFYQILGILIVIILAKEIGINIAFSDWCWIFGVLSLILFIPITLGGLGLREGTLIGLLGYMGIPQEKALALSISIFGIQLIFAILGGILSLQLDVKKHGS